MYIIYVWTGGYARFLEWSESELALARMRTSSDPPVNLMCVEIMLVRVLVGSFPNPPLRERVKESEAEHSKCSSSFRVLPLYILTRPDYMPADPNYALDLNFNEQ